MLTQPILIWSKRSSYQRWYFMVCPKQKPKSYFFVITVTGPQMPQTHRHMLQMCTRCHQTHAYTYIPPPSIILTPSERFTNQPASSHLMKKRHMEFHYPLEFSPHANSLGEKVRLLDNWKPQCRHSVTRCRPGWVAMDGKCSRAVCAFAICTCMCKYIQSLLISCRRTVHSVVQTLHIHQVCVSVPPSVSFWQS